mmetsp:Transcript_5341/g.4922  ORF Transcript_5341/g.4922 Transcript_5341/m.4922 type:complete len:192 (+) Transcript_5341:786-1361(+)
MIFAFCLDLDIFLNKDLKNVAAIHCKAGKGRTGVMICCYLIFSRFCNTALDAMKYYAMIRTKNKKGITIPSQIRYVHYFEHFLELRKKAFPKILNKMPRVVCKILKIRMITIPKISQGGFKPTLKIYCKNVLLYDYKSEGNLKFLSGLPYFDFKINSTTVMAYDDVKIEFFHKNKKSEKAFHFWFNTSFAD